MPDEATNNAGVHVLKVNLAPSTDTRAIIKDLNSKNVFFKWEVGNFDLNVVFKQGATLSIVRGVQITDANGEFCSFEVTLPEAVNPEESFDLYGIVAENIKLKDGKVWVEVGAHGLYELTNYSSNRDGAVPVYFKSEGVSLDSEVNAVFNHLGAMAVVAIKNTSDKPFRIAGVAARPVKSAAEFYLKAALPFEGNTTLPYLNILDLTEATQDFATRVVYPSVEIAPNDVQHVGFWFRPNELGNTPEINLVAYDAEARKAIVSTNTRPARATAMQVGRAYNIYATWDGTNLTMLDEELERDLPADQPKIVFTTNQNIGDEIPLVIQATTPDAERDIWIDLNDNQVRDKGEYVTEFAESLKFSEARFYKIGAKKITIYGEVANFSFIGNYDSEGYVVPNSGLASIDVSGNTLLDQLFIYESQLTSVDLSKNTKLRRVGFEYCELTSFTMPTEAAGMQELYLTGNQLTTVDLTAAPNLLGVSVAGNEIATITVPKFTTLWIAEFQNNKLEAAAINTIYDSLQKGEQKFAEWMFTIYVYNNPGALTASKSTAMFKGWTVVNQDPSAATAAAQAQPSMARRVMATPLANLKP